MMKFMHSFPNLDFPQDLIKYIILLAGSVYSLGNWILILIFYLQMNIK